MHKIIELAGIQQLPDIKACPQANRLACTDKPSKVDGHPPYNIHKVVKYYRVGKNSETSIPLMIAFVVSEWEWVSFSGIKGNGQSQNSNGKG
jgi:hypothetical protein